MKLFVFSVFVTLCCLLQSQWISAAPIPAGDELTTKDIDEVQDQADDNLRDRVKESVSGALKTYRSTDAQNDLVSADDDVNDHGDTVAYKFNNIGATVTKYRDPELGDSTKTAVSYVVADQPDSHAAITGFRTNTVLDDGSRISNAGASYDLRSSNGDYLSIGGTKPDNAEDGHIVAHLAGRRTIVSNGRTKVDLEGRATRIIGGTLNGKQQIKFNLGVSQSL